MQIVVTAIPNSMRQQQIGQDKSKFTVAITKFIGAKKINHSKSKFTKAKTNSPQ